MPVYQVIISVFAVVLWSGGGISLSIVRCIISDLLVVSVGYIQHWYIKV